MFVVMTRWRSACFNNQHLGLWVPAFAGTTGECNYFLSGPEIVLSEPSGAACMLGGVCPCGLSAGAPP